MRNLTFLLVVIGMAVNALGQPWDRAGEWAHAAASTWKRWVDVLKSKSRALAARRPAPALQPLVN